MSLHPHQLLASHAELGAIDFVSSERRRPHHRPAKRGRRAMDAPVSCAYPAAALARLTDDAFGPSRARRKTPVFRESLFPAPACPELHGGRMADWSTCRRQPRDRAPSWCRWSCDEISAVSVELLLGPHPTSARSPRIWSSARRRNHLRGSARYGCRAARFTRCKSILELLVAGVVSNGVAALVSFFHDAKSRGNSRANRIEGVQK